MSDTHNAFDLTTEAGVEAYLADTPYACTRAATLSGGSGNFAYRIYLRQPYEGASTVVLKHSKPYVKAMRNITFDVKRQVFEVEALRRIREWSPASAFVTVPTVYSHDEKEHAIIMSDCGAESSDWKGSWGTSSEGFMHGGRGNKEVCDFFDGNQEAKVMASWVSYGRVLETFDGSLEKLRDPDVRVSEEEGKTLGRIVEEMDDAIKNATGTFVMGDFWPGNLVLSSDEANNISQLFVLDWEVARPGLFSLELGQFCAELVLLMRFNTTVCGQDAGLLLDEFLSSYARQIKPDFEMCRRAIVHLGVHLVTWTPRLEWGGKEATQEVVKEGLGLILDGYIAEEEWLQKSVIGTLAKSVT
ncbi:hypothetical protein NP233_g4282 [Leucocoprinus birnbaumii]|uniref:Aminoglycoside phosphotransferase domain-containing protein n=1 Tax=Leucocoprinus birnbaumii TaxID=56174 RepID=A0AAD5YSZ5_9AGAR|nr:hypothetical protein NP233_g4282 [Leucocoprinus birnbaumii]